MDSFKDLFDQINECFEVDSYLGENNPPIEIREDATMQDLTILYSKLDRFIKKNIGVIPNKKPIWDHFNNG